MPIKRFAFSQRFLLPLLIVGILSIFSTAIYMFTANMSSIKQDAQIETSKLSRILVMAENLVGERVYSSMQLLKRNGSSLGVPTINHTITLTDKAVPKMMFGSTSVTEKADLVDDVTDIGNGTASIFVKHKNSFIRITTNVRKKDNRRAIGTQLDPNGKVIKRLQKGLTFYGVVDILGEPYITGYEPIIDNTNKVIGAWYVGYKVDVKALDQAIKKWDFLKTGFAAITDYNNIVRFVSEHTNKQRAHDIIFGKSSQWTIVKKDIPNWNFKAYIAYPKKKAYLSSFKQLYPLLITGGLFGIALSFIALGAMKRFVLIPLGGEPDTASTLVSRIAEGDFRDDSTIAKPGTLIHNILKMRSQLREMVSEIHEKADRLSISSSVFAHAHDGIFITDAEANIIDVNPAFSTITGYKRAESLAQSPASLGFADEIETFFSQFSELTARNHRWEGETWSINKAGETYLIWLNIIPVLNETGQFQHHVGLFSDITQKKEQQNLLEHQAFHDTLTQLPNRALFTTRLQQTLANAEEFNEVIAICYIDLDSFKPINDQYGHSIGDQLLILLASRLQNTLNKNDTIARLGGDEFALLLKGRDAPKAYKKELGRILSAIEKPFMIKPHNLKISASVGYTIFPDDNNPPEILMRHADHAMYHAKTHGGKHYHLFDPDLAQQSRDQQQVEKEIALAIKNHEFRLHYQPQINQDTGLVVGMEALIRWQHPAQGLLAPRDFLPFIEHTPLMIEIGQWALHNALSQIAEWNQENLNFYVAVNIDAYHLTEKSFAKKLSAAFKKHSTVSGNQLSLEITETAAINDVNNVTDIINACKKLGVTFAIDDFGSGYSSLIYLRRLPVDFIKIDRSFIHGMLKDSEDMAVVSGIITLCKEFRRHVIAEGVESADEADKLSELGCLHLQGFGIAKPMPADQVLPWVKANTPFKFKVRKKKR